MEGTGVDRRASIDRERGLLSTIVLEMGGSSDLCAQLLQPGEPVILMGPTSTPTETPPGETVLLVGRRPPATPVLFSIGAALRAEARACSMSLATRRSPTATRSPISRPRADHCLVLRRGRPALCPGRPQDRAFVGNIVEAIEGLGAGRLGPIGSAPWPRVDRDHRDPGSDMTMNAVAPRRAAPSSRSISALSTRRSRRSTRRCRCMMKEICAQCLQHQRDPVTGTETASSFPASTRTRTWTGRFSDPAPAPIAEWRAGKKLTRLWIDRALKQLGRREEVAAAE